jgi:hypothetical protein
MGTANGENEKKQDEKQGQLDVSNIPQQQSELMLNNLRNGRCQINTPVPQGLTAQSLPIRKENQVQSNPDQHSPSSSISEEHGNTELKVDKFEQLMKLLKAGVTAPEANAEANGSVSHRASQ